MQNQLSRKRSVLIMLLCVLMVLTIPSGTVFADTTGTTNSTVKSAIWDQFPKIGNLTKDTMEGVDLSMYQTNLGWNKKFTNYQQKPIANLMTFMKSQGVNTVTVKVAVNPSKGDQEQKNLCTLESGINPSGGAGSRNEDQYGSSVRRLDDLQGRADSVQILGWQGGSRCR